MKRALSKLSRARARESTERLFRFLLEARRRYAVQKNGMGPFLSRASDRGISFFILSIDEDEGEQFVSPHGARPQKPETAARHG